MTIVIDASIAASWFLPDEATSETDAILYRVRRDKGDAPSLLWFELRQLLLNAERRGRLPQGEAANAMQRAVRLDVRDRGIGRNALIFRLAAKHALSAYNSSYLSLTVTEGLPLATLDKPLAAAAHAEQVEVIGPFAQSN